MNRIIDRRLRRPELAWAWLPIGLASLPCTTAAANDPSATTLSDDARVEIVGDTLEIEGTSEDDRILVRAGGTPDTVKVILNHQHLGRFGPIARIEIHAGDGDDTVRVSGQVELPVRINGGPGDDRLRGGSGHDLVFGEDGDDVLFASRGRDAFDGGAGSNELKLGRPTERIWVSSASGDAARILSQAYRLVPLDTRGPAAELGPVVVGPADLADDSIADHLRTAYQAGHTIALTGAAAEHAEALRGLLGHASRAGWSEDFPQADLVAFRRAIGPDGSTGESTSILLPRQAVEGSSPAEARRGGRTADLRAVEALSQVFSGTPVVPESPPDGGACVSVPAGNQCLQTLATYYQSTALQSNTSGDTVQTVNWAYALRSFMNQEDLYYVLQEIDYHVGTINSLGALFGWFQSATNTLLDESPPPLVILTSPQTTQVTTSVTSGVSESVGGAAGWNQQQGLNATLTGGVTISDSRTVQIPPIQITNQTNPATGVASWVYNVNDATNITRPETITFYNQWIWGVPFTTYDTGQDTIEFHSSSVQDINDGPNGTRGLKADLNSTVPLPFGDTFALQPPVVASVDPDDVCAGDEFTITGTGLYPGLVQAVLIDGTTLDQSAFSTVSDTEITVVAPDMLGIALPVTVQTEQGLSNDDVTIAIDPLCEADGAAADEVVMEADQP